MAVSVGSRVLVPEADDVTQLVDHDAKLVTVLADGDGLGAPAAAAHVGAAPGGRGQLRGAVPSWGSASTQGPGVVARGAKEQRGAGGPGCVLGAEPRPGQLLGRRPHGGRGQMAQAMPGATAAVPGTEHGLGRWPGCRAQGPLLTRRGGR